MKNKSIFLEYIGDSAVSRVIDFLITGRMYDYSLTDLARNAGISWSTLKRIFPQLVKHKIVKYTRTIGRSKLYRINYENPSVQKLIEMRDFIVEQEVSSLEVRKITEQS